MPSMPSIDPAILTVIAARSMPTCKLWQHVLHDVYHSRTLYLAHHAQVFVNKNDSLKEWHKQLE